MTLSWKGGFDIQISATLSLTGCNSANDQDAVWDSASDFFVCFFDETCPGFDSICLETGIGVDVDSWCVAFNKFYQLAILVVAPQLLLLLGQLSSGLDFVQLSERVVLAMEQVHWTFEV